MALTGTFDRGTSGSTITTGDTGNENAWDVVSIAANATLTYSATQTRGRMAAKVTAATGSPCTAYVGWTTSFGSKTNHYGRLYLYPSEFWQTDTVIKVTLGDVNTQAAAILLDTNNVVFLRDSLNVTQASGGVQLANNQWNRLEFHVIHSVTVGQVECKVFRGPSADGINPDETVATAANINTLASADQIYFGLLNNDVPFTFWMDGIIAAETAYPGPLSTMKVRSPQLDFDYAR